jgi:protein-tyrosine kinase
MGRIEDALRRAADERERGGPLPPARVESEAFAPEPPEGDVTAHAFRGAETAVLEREPPREQPVHREPVLGEPVPLIERLSATLPEKVVVDANTTQLSREQYRKLAATLHQTQAVSGINVIMIASAMAGEGKTLTSSNLALTLSESYKRRVLLIDGDLRRPSLHTVFGLDGSVGLSEGLLSAEDRRFAVQQMSPHLTVLPAGRPSLDPMAGLTSDRMRRLLAEARSGFDWVIIDTPPVGLLPDGHLLASMVDGVLLVVKAGETPHGVVQRAIESLGRDRIIGVVLNQSAQDSMPNYYSYRYQYGTRPAAAE